MPSNKIQPRFPSEVSLHIQSFLPQIFKHLILDSLRWQRTAKEMHGAAWGGIFKDEVWLSAITKMGFNPVLIGDLDRYMNNEQCYLAIVLGQDRDGGTKCDLGELQEVFFQSLQNHTWKERPEYSEYFFSETRLTLNVKDAIHELHFTYVSRPEELLSQGPEYSSSYLYWNDNKYKVRKISPNKVIGVQKGVTKSVFEVFGLEWKHISSRIPRQHYFAMNGATLKLRELRNNGLLTGWSLEE